MPRVLLGGTYMVPEPPQFNWESLESVSGLAFTEEQRTAFVAAMHRYIRYLTLQSTAVQIKDIRHQCKEIFKHANALADLLSIHTKNTPRNKDPITFHQNVFSLFPTDFDSRTYLRAMIQLRLGAKIALQKLSKKGKPGRQDKEGLDVTIRACYAIYLAAGGSGSGCTRSGSSGRAKGPFLDLIAEALGQLQESSEGNLVIDDIPHTKNALAQRILVALKQSMPPPERDEK
jgi:hypothetical protein